MSKINKKSAILLIFALAALFIAAVIISFSFFAPSNGLKIVAAPVESAQLLSGEVRPGYAERELLPGEKINLNTASQEELQRLPGIGELLSEAIIEYRQTNGNFQALEDIMKVSGIGEKSFLNISNYISIGE